MTTTWETVLECEKVNVMKMLARSERSDSEYDKSLTTGPCQCEKKEEKNQIVISER